MATTQVLKPLEAKAYALLLSARLADALNLQEATLLTGIQIIASATQARSSRLQPGHWSLQHVLAEFEDFTETERFSVF